MSPQEEFSPLKPIWHSGQTVYLQRHVIHWEPKNTISHELTQQKKLLETFFFWASQPRKITRFTIRRRAWPENWPLGGCKSLVLMLVMDPGMRHTMQKLNGRSITIKLFWPHAQLSSFHRNVAASRWTQTVIFRLYRCYVWTESGSQSQVSMLT